MVRRAVSLSPPTETFPMDFSRSPVVSHLPLAHRAPASSEPTYARYSPATRRPPPSSTTPNSSPRSWSPTPFPVLGIPSPYGSYAPMGDCGSACGTAVRILRNRDAPDRGRGLGRSSTRRAGAGSGCCGHAPTSGVTTSSSTDAVTAAARRSGRSGVPRAHRLHAQAVQGRFPCAAKRAVADRRCRQAMARSGRRRVPQPLIRRVLNAMSPIRIAYDGEAGSAWQNCQPSPA